MHSFLTAAVTSFFSSYLFLFGLGLIAVITEWKRIYAENYKKVFSLFTFPFFMMTYVPISIAAMFCSVEWKPIEHRAAVTLEEVTHTNLAIKVGADPLIANGGAHNGADDPGSR